MTKRTSGVVGGNRRRVSGAQAAPPPTTFRLFSGVPGPSTVTSFSGPFGAAVGFTVTSAVSLKGYSFWCASDGDTAAQKFCLWEANGALVGTLVPGTTVTSAPLVQGQWNDVALAPPVALTVGAVYVAETAWQAVAGFPFTGFQFGSGDPYDAGIINGPLDAFSDLGASNPAPHGWYPQGSFQDVNNDPTLQIPNNAFDSANFWMDIIVG